MLRTSAHKVQTLRSHPKERKEHSEKGEYLKSVMSNVCKQLGIIQ
jgi:hypothetical protein